MNTPRKNILRNASALLAFTVAGALPAHAALLAIDTFEDYTVASNIHGESGGTGWNGAWSVQSIGSSSTGTAAISSTSISYDQGGITRGGGNSLLLLDGSNGTQRNVFSSVNTDGSDYFVSYIFQVSGSVFMGLQAKDSDPVLLNDSISVVTTPGTPGNLGSVRARVANSDVNSSAGSVVPNTTYFLVTQYTGWTGTNYSTVNVWINPVAGDPSLSSISATNTVATAGAGSDGFIGLYMRTSGINGGADPAESFLIDDLRVGTSWGSVTAIPEPGSTALLAAGVATLFALTSRRRRA